MREVGKRSARGARLAGAVDGDVHAGDFGAFGQVPELGGVKFSGGVGVDHFPAGLAVEMDVLVQVGAVARLAALKVHLLDEAGRGEVLQAVINRGQRNAGRAGFDAVKDIRGGGVICGGGQNLKNLTAMGREAHIRTQESHPALEASGRWGRA